ncbi:xylose isomerase [Skermanella sp. TT6]|uniref:Xylose isomerase n=1 Tax=Skermanella cutis TaxID=2775420 RepID=A0ABX7B1W4_9PROT|nr:xylose isomerase [Skermanella sp. TT6]QQP87422.1 xylose isomerase [Skermanella sp. TT6]
MTAPFFDKIGRIPFKGPESDDPLAFRNYEPDRMVLGKRMEDHLRVAVCWWHTFCWPGVDMFGAGTFDRPWQAADTMENAELKLHAAFEFFEKLGVPFFCFHDADVAPLGETISEGDANLARIEELMRDGIDRTGVRLLWGTANLFSHRRYMAGGATNPDPEVFAFAAAQVARVLEMTHRLGGENYVLWGGREGYDTLLNTDMKRELDQLGRFMSLVVEHKHRIGFKGTILIEPKPMEPTKHQYDHDAATVHAFLRKYGLENEIKLNLEVNHATLAGHSFEHEVAYAIANDLMGSFDINRGDPQNGWDTDQFPNDDREAALALYHVLSAGGLTTGGFNFDAKVRRQSIDAEDLFIAHIGGMDTLARGLLMAERMIGDGKLASHVADRYAGWNEGLGADILDGRVGLGDLAKLARDRNLKPEPRSGRQEYLENLVNRY